jgi:cation diffusion facilitator family transporter
VNGAVQNLARGRRIAAYSIVASAVLSILNIAVGYSGGSTSVTAAGFEFAGDVLASALVFAGMTLAARPPDENHPYGHGRIELLAGLTVGLILAAGGAAICFRSLQRLSEIHAPPPRYSAAPLLLAIVVRTVTSTIKFRVGRRIRSISLVADAWNDAVDILASAAALCALALTLYDPVQFIDADHYGGFAVGLLVIYTGLRVLRDASLDLIDTMPDESLTERIRAKAAEVEGVFGVEKTFARKTGLQYHVELHIEVHPSISVAESHEIAGRVRTRIRREVAEVADVLVHIEPHEPASE